MDTIGSNCIITSVAIDVNVLAPLLTGVDSRERIVTTFEEDSPAPYLKISLITT